MSVVCSGQGEGSVEEQGARVQLLFFRSQPGPLWLLDVSEPWFSICNTAFKNQSQDLLLFIFPDTRMRLAFPKCLSLQSHKPTFCPSSRERDRKETPTTPVTPSLALFSPLFFRLWLRKPEKIHPAQEPSLFLCLQGNMSNGLFHQGCFSWTWCTPARIETCDLKERDLKSTSNVPYRAAPVSGKVGISFLRWVIFLFKQKFYSFKIVVESFPGATWDRPEQGYSGLEQKPQLGARPVLAQGRSLASATHHPLVIVPCTGSHSVFFFLGHMLI